MIDLKIDTKQIDDFAKRLQNKADSMTKEINATLNNWGSDVIVYARQNHRFKTHSGLLEKSISKKMATSGMPKLFLYLNSKTAVYGKFIHDGTEGGKPIKPKNKDALRFNTGSGFAYSKGHKSGKIVADNFLERAIDQLKPKLASDLKSELKKRI